MAGYEWWPVCRITHTDKATVTLDLREEMWFTDGPTRVQGPNYEMVMVEREDVNRVQRPRYFGFRVSFGLDFEIGDDMTDHSLLSRIVNAFNDPAATVSMSLDGGTKFADVDLTSYQGPQPFGGKTFAGASFSLGFRCKNLIDEIPDISTGVWI